MSSRPTDSAPAAVAVKSASVNAYEGYSIRLFCLFVYASTTLLFTVFN